MIACTALRTNLTIRELGALFRVSKSQVHRILGNLIPRLAHLLGLTVVRDRRWSWIVDGTLVPTRDHMAAARSKNYRWSCNAQVLVRRRDLRVVEVSGGGPGNRNDTIHYRGSPIEALCRQHARVLADGGYRGIHELLTPVFQRNRILRDENWRRHRKRRARAEHALARLKDWRVLRDHRRRGRSLAQTLAAVAFLHNLRIAMPQELRDSSLATLPHSLFALPHLNCSGAFCHHNGRRIQRAAPQIAGEPPGL
ncbi:MAG TPA: transposase, partial [Bryobacteraceae bacterium]|nr:transposase [Bryobacteraceae bacterium]